MSAAIAVGRSPTSLGPGLRTAATTATALFAGAISAALLGALWIGRDYYRLPREARAAHELDPLLSAGGSLGVALGLLGTSLMVVMLLYSVRKALPRWKVLGPPSGWLRFHVICGVGGPLAIWLHTGFVWPQGLVAVAFWCMVAVALSGTFGRYVYAMLPRATGGRALALDEAAAALADLRAELVASTADVDPDRLAEALAAVQDFDVPVRTLPDLLRLNRELRRRRRVVDAVVHELPADVREATRRAFVSQLTLKRGLEAGRVAGRLLRYWHLFHRPLAGAMYVIVALHVASAVLFGGSLARLSGHWGG
jgi:hypothetical protein